MSAFNSTEPAKFKVELGNAMLFEGHHLRQAMRAAKRAAARLKQAVQVRHNLGTSWTVSVEGIATLDHHGHTGT